MKPKEDRMFQSTEEPSTSAPASNPVSASGGEARLAGDESGESQFGSPWPGFLDQLDGNAENAFTDFYLFAREMFRTQAPRMLRRIPVDQREDMLHEVVHHCCRNDFRILRKYENRGSPFANWLKCVANRKIIDELERRGRILALEEPNDSLQRLALDLLRPDMHAEAANALEDTLDRLADMDEECQILVHAMASGMKPMEVTKLLGWSEKDNRKASDRCRYVRRRLKEPKR
jgi:RNA polymerase sigma factor (sigma-70 family)